MGRMASTFKWHWFGGRTAGWPSSREIVAKLEAHKDLCMPCLRIFLGVALMVRAATFIVERDALAALAVEHDIVWLGAWLVHFVVLTHVAGGLMMALGLGTRIGALIQVPNLLGAVFLVHGFGGLFSLTEETRLSVLTLLLLLLFVWHGSGKLSLDAARVQDGADEA